MKRLIAGLSRNRGGLVLLSGVSAVLTGIERVLSRRPTRTPGSTTSRLVTPVSAPALTEADRFRIYRSKTDLSYAYWVLQGKGCFASFSLFDTWEQAMQEANRRIAIAQRVTVLPKVLSAPSVPVQR